MKNIVWTRIDDRLIHGQVVISWIPFLKINQVIVVDDEYADDDFMMQIICNAAPDSVEAKVMSVKQAVEYFCSDTGDRKDERILILSRNVENINSLLEQNVNINKVNIGGLGYLEGRKQYYNFLHMNSNETAILRNMQDKGIDVQIQMLPKETAIKFS